MLEISQRTMKLRYSNPKREFHGEENKLRIHIGFEWTCGNSELDTIATGFLASLYRKGDGPQDELEGVDAKLTALKFPFLKPLKSDQEFESYVLHVHLGGPKQDLHFDDANVSKISFDPKEGGSVGVMFVVAVYPDEKQAGRLATLLINGDVTISLKPSEVDVQAGNKQEELQ